MSRWMIRTTQTTILGDFDISRRELLTTLRVLGGSLARDATGWGILEGVVALRQ